MSYYTGVAGTTPSSGAQLNPVGEFKDVPTYSGGDYSHQFADSSPKFYAPQQTSGNFSSTEYFPQETQGASFSAQPAYYVPQNTQGNIIYQAPIVSPQPVFVAPVVGYVPGYHQATNFYPAPVIPPLYPIQPPGYYVPQNTQGNSFYPAPSMLPQYEVGGNNLSKVPQPAVPQFAGIPPGSPMLLPQIPAQFPAQPPPQYPTQPPQTQLPPGYPTQFPAQPPTQFPTQPPTRLPPQIPTQPLTQPPNQPPAQFPTRPPVELPTQPPPQVPSKVEEHPRGHVHPPDCPICAVYKQLDLDIAELRTRIIALETQFADWTRKWQGEI